MPDAPQAKVTTYNGLRVVPTIPGSFARLQEGLTRVVHNLEQVRFDQIGEELKKTLQESKATLKEIGGLSQTINHEAVPRLLTTLVELQKTLLEVQKGLGKDSPLSYTTTKTMEELSQTMRALRELINTLDNQPQSIIFGKEKTSGE